MKKIVFAIIMMMMFSGVCLADYSSRISEKTKQQQDILTQIQQAQDFIQQKQAEILKLQGAIETLTALDKEDEVKEDTQKVKGKK